MGSSEKERKVKQFGFDRTEILYVLCFRIGRTYLGIGDVMNVTSRGFVSKISFYFSKEKLIFNDNVQTVLA